MLSNPQYGVFTCLYEAGFACTGEVRPQMQLQCMSETGFYIAGAVCPRATDI